MHSTLTSHGYSKSIKAVRRQRNLGLLKLWCECLHMYTTWASSTLKVSSVGTLIASLSYSHGWSVTHGLGVWYGYSDADGGKYRIRSVISHGLPSCLVMLHCTVSNICNKQWINLISYRIYSPSYGTTGSMIPQYLFCLFLCTAVPPAGFSIYIFINTTVIFIGTSGHSVQMSWIFVSTRIFIFSLEIADIFILPWCHAL